MSYARAETEDGAAVRVSFEADSDGDDHFLAVEVQDERTCETVLRFYFDREEVPELRQALERAMTAMSKAYLEGLEARS